MPGPYRRSQERKERLRKGACRSAIPALFTITEEEEGHRGARRRQRVSDSQNQTAERRASSGPDSSSSGQALSNTPALTLSPTPTPSHNAANKPELLVLKVDERQRMARERREEKEKQIAARELAWQEKEEKAKQYYEKHLEERRRRLEEQRMKEDKRRAAVEEKRRHKLEEEKARHEAVLRRTVERSQRAKQNRWSWGGALPVNTPTTPRGFVESSFLYPLDLAGLEHHLQGAFSVYRRYGLSHQYAERRSVSTMNLSKHPADQVITKRLSYSSATLLHSPDRALQKRTSSSPFLSKSQSKLRPSGGKATNDSPAGMRRMPLTPWENTVVSRLLQPTHSYLARSRSAVSLSGDAVSCHPMGSTSFKSIQSQPLAPCRNHEPRLPKDVTNRRKTTGNLLEKHKDFVRKSWTNLSLPLTTPPRNLPPAKRSQSPGKQQSRVTAPSPGRPRQKPSPRPPPPKQLHSPSGEDVGNLRPSRVAPESFSLIGPQPGGGPEGDQAGLTPSPMQPRPQTQGQLKASLHTDTDDTTVNQCVDSPPAQRPTTGTTDPEEATRILAEKRRQAREQREKEEQERREQEEQERRGKEEMARRKAEERQRREEEAQRQAEEKNRREEEERQEEEKRVQQQEEEEAQRQQQLRDEEEYRQKEEAEKLRMEREKHFQKEEAERMERKKRLEEIMKRTRRSDPAEKKTNPPKTGDQSAPPPSVSLSEAEVEHSDSNGHGAPDPNRDLNISMLPPTEESEDGSFEEVLFLPSESRPPPSGEEDEEHDHHLPVIAFRENGIVKPMSGGTDNVSLQHRADVV
ncbi:ensconsin isoform X2 [Esox lucius]|uniref:ensconsin isoform X2 n=1 Tax=Esox lucius TaxID=8010 RepID=UPI0014774DC6|nr:ensconsin isoform X2 [Esox lucius]